MKNIVTFFIVFLFSFISISYADEESEEENYKNKVNQSMIELGKINNGTFYMDNVDSIILKYGEDKTMLAEIQSLSTDMIDFFTSSNQLSDSDYDSMKVLYYLSARIEYNTFLIEYNNFLKIEKLLLNSHEEDIYKTSGDDYMDNGYGIIPSANWSTTASISNKTSKFAFDGNKYTRWATNNQTQRKGQVFQIDMQKIYTFNSIILDSTSQPLDYIRGYSIFVSNDGKLWNKVISGKNTDEYTVIDFEKQISRYIKIVQTESAERWWTISELKVIYK